MQLLPPPANLHTSRSTVAPPAAQPGDCQHVAALLVMQPQRRPSFLQALLSLNTEACLVETCWEARELLRQPNSFGLIVTDVTLPDGNWCDVLRALVDSGTGASLVVASCQEDQNLWSEVFWRGGYDLLVLPSDWNDVCHCLQAALRSRPTGREVDRAFPQTAEAQPH